MAALGRLGAALRSTVAARVSVPINTAVPVGISHSSVLDQIREASNKLFVGGLKWEIEEDDLYEAFNKYAPTYAKVIRDRETQRSKGFAFVTFNSEDEAAEAQKELDGVELFGRNIRVDFAIERPMGERPPPRGPPGGGGYDAEGSSSF